MKLKLIDDWKDCWRWSSNRCMATVISIISAWLAIPTDLRAAVPIWAVGGTAIAVLVLGILGRVTQWHPKEAPKPVKKPTKKRKR